MLEKFKDYLRVKAGLTDEQFTAISGKLKTRKIAKGTILLRQGEVCHHSFFVSSGLLRSYTIDTAGKEHIIQFAPENWMITDRSSNYFNEPSELFIDAIEDTEFILVTNEFIDAAACSSQSFQRYDNRALHNHIRHLQSRVSLLLGATAEQRYLDFIKLYTELTLRIPQWMIASYLGITPESLSRVRKELAHKNFKPY
ncbi:Crp/Fnr family transcriptional regulator (plasmid) [Pedobacter sp. BS3]|uniref:Crp/Fnr family transcriptional regulator n=1 Tax=Pedobacter sp. BS3 TaxID=2567937 RepID=UPI0011F0360C|nr:Crp/Fnr family transcriptional regulator [Pedobacter sp. BS3]TZF85868.1 Crp/Fnr family transcriptional regulator [Pedobacter sp. BS3]